jgi:hypothetical protein
MRRIFHVWMYERKWRALFHHYGIYNYFSMEASLINPLLYHLLLLPGPERKMHRVLLHFLSC